MKREKKFVAIVAAAWLLLAAVNLAAPKVDFSEMENRYLAPLPPLSVDGLLSGKFMSGFESYLSDHFIGRDAWVAAKSTAEYLVGKRENNGVYIADNALIERIADPNLKTADVNAQGVRDFIAKTHLPAVFALVPSAEEIDKSKLPPFAPAFDQGDFIRSMNEAVKGSAAAVDICGALKGHSADYLYYRTDHHWTAEGAYLAYAQAAPALGLSVRDYHDFSVKQVSDSFYGTLYSKSGFRFVAPDTMEAPSVPDVTFTISKGGGPTVYDRIYFDEWLSQKDKYSYFLGQNEAVVSIKTGVENGKKLLIFRDSYANTFVPYLLRDYSEVTLVDLRYLNTDVAGTVPIGTYDEALFLYSVDIFSHTDVTSKLSA